MSEYQISSTILPIQVVFAGSPETLIINHSTKNVVYIGNNNMIGSGNLADATPLDPYASIVVNGQADVWCVAAANNAPCQVLTQSNAINWSPKAVQPDIADPSSPYTAPAGGHTAVITAPPLAAGLSLSWSSSTTITSLQVVGVQSGAVYGTFTPSSLAETNVWLPVFTDVDTTFQVITSAGAIFAGLIIVWIMTPFAAGLVKDGHVADVNIAGLGGTPGGVVSGSSLPVTEQSKHMWATQPPVAFDLNLAANAVGNIIPAVGGITLILHDIRVEVVTATAIGYAVIQDTSGANLANLFMNGNAAADSPAGNNNFHGAPVGANLGLQLKNNTVAAQRYVGYVTYSQ